MDVLGTRSKYAVRCGGHPRQGRWRQAVTLKESAIHRSTTSGVDRQHPRFPGRTGHCTVFGGGGGSTISATSTSCGVNRKENNSADTLCSREALVVVGIWPSSISGATSRGTFVCRGSTSTIC